VRASNSLHANFTITAHVVVHPCGILARVPDVEALTAKITDRTPRRAWCIAGGTLIVLAPWSHLTLEAILERWPAAEVARVQSLHDRPAEGRQAA
jgi:hypothetical protein